MIDKLKKELIDSRIIINDLSTREKYEEDDIRICFFDGHHSYFAQSLNFYLLLNSNLFSDNCKVIYSNNSLSIKDLNDIAHHSKNIINSQIIINSWSNFEFGITLILDAILEDELKLKLLNSHCSEIIKIIGALELGSDQYQALRKKLVIKQLALVPNQRKYQTLFKYLGNEYIRDKKMI